MPRINLTQEQVDQLNDWLYGGPTDPTGLIAWLANPANANADPGVIAQAEGERDLYLLLLAKNGGNLVPGRDLTPNMVQALLWVAGTLDWAEGEGHPTSVHQERMRGLWRDLGGSA